MPVLLTGGDNLLLEVPFPSRLSPAQPWMPARSTAARREMAASLHRAEAVEFEREASMEERSRRADAAMVADDVSSWVGSGASKSLRFERRVSMSY